MKSNNRPQGESDYLELMEQVYIDATIKCSADVSDLRDLITIRSRFKHEGLSFLTISLPQFCRDFERSIALGAISSTFFRGFNRVRNGSIPELFQGMIGQMFERETGRMFEYEEPTSISRGVSSDFPTIIESVRQLCLTFKKVEVACTPTRVQAALDSFISIEQSFESFSVPSEELQEFSWISSMLWGNLVADFSVSKCIPKHGPGATAERISGNQKFIWQRWHDRLEPYFPLIDNGYPLGTPVDSQELELVSIIPEAEEQPVRVVPVPKTLKSPRIIAIEPCCMQYVQQGVRDFLYEKLETYWLTAGHINFADQSVNQRLAVMSSRNGQFATIDLSDASDRVPRSLALEMFRCNPILKDCIDSCRTTKAELPNGRIVDPLQKFASMGSALCFPVEAMYFYTICVMALLKSQNLPITFKNLFEVSRGLYVYGDDIIVPSANAEIVLDYLRKYNCKVNADKTFVSGSFRESCGVDAFAGYPVTPVYLRQIRPENKQQAERIISWVETANLFYLKGYWKTAQFMFAKCERIIGNIPYGSENSSYLCRISFLGSRYTTSQKDVRWNEDYQRLEIKALVSKPIYRTDRLEGYGALMKCFSGSGVQNPVIKNHWAYFNLDAQERSELERSARYGAVALKRRWAPAQ